MQAFLAAVPFLMLLVMLWTAWRVLGVFHTIMVPARIRHLQPSADGAAVHLVLETRETDGSKGEARLDLPSARGLKAGQRVTLWRGSHLALAWFSHATLTLLVIGGIAVVWLAMYLPFV